MKTKVLTFAACCALLLAVSACGGKDKVVVTRGATPQLVSTNDTLSWALGFNMAQIIASTGVDVNREVLFQAITNTLDTMQQPLTQQQMNYAASELDRMIFTQQAAKRQNAKLTEEAYFDKLQQDNPAIKKDERGFYYEVLKEGKGPKGELGMIAYFDYKATFVNGQVFDQTYGNRQPITHVIGEPMMPGLQYAFCLMTPGSTYRFYFPSEMAFGSQGTESVPPYTPLVYEVEVHDIYD